MQPVKTSGIYENQPNPFGFTSRMALSARRKMFRQLMERIKPEPAWTVLDVGVTCNRRVESNFFEKMYPWSASITATGIEDGVFLAEDFPGLRFLRTAPGPLPFADREFDLVVSFAVLEHVGSRAQQSAFVREMHRVGKRVFITTPNRFYPVEFHTLTPFLHWLPMPLFRRYLRLIGNPFYAQEENLNLLTRMEFFEMLPVDWRIEPAHSRFFGLMSNLCFYSQRT